jgi:hypothetical protein
MMRPEVRIVQQQTEEIKPAQISRSEEEALLAKYGFKSPQPNYNKPSNPKNNLTFEDMVKQQEAELAQRQRKMSPKPTTFSSNDYYSDEKWGSDDGLNFKVTIVSDMKF